MAAMLCLAARVYRAAWNGLPRLVQCGVCFFFSLFFCKRASSILEPARMGDEEAASCKGAEAADDDGCFALASTSDGRELAKPNGMRSSSMPYDDDWAAQNRLTVLPASIASLGPICQTKPGKKSK